MKAVALAIISAGLRRKFWAMDPPELSQTRREIILSAQTFFEDQFRFLEKMQGDDKQTCTSYFGELDKALHDLELTGDHSSMLIFEMAKVETIRKEIESFQLSNKMLAA